MRQPTATASPPAKAPKQSKVRTIDLVLVLISVVSAGAAVWSANEAHRGNDFGQKDASSAAITSATPNERDSRGCVHIGEKETLQLSGTAKMAKGNILWEITQGVNDSSLWPGPKAKMTPGASTWNMPAVGPFGGATDQGHSFTILLISVPPNGAGELDPKASATGSSYKALKALPDNTQILAQLCVTRT